MRVNFDILMFFWIESSELSSFYNYDGEGHLSSGVKDRFWLGY